MPSPVVRKTVMPVKDVEKPKHSVCTARLQAVKEENGDLKNGMQVVENGKQVKDKQTEATKGTFDILIICVS